jgi:hypothetical protein
LPGVSAPDSSPSVVSKLGVPGVSAVSCAFVPSVPGSALLGRPLNRAATFLLLRPPPRELGKPGVHVKH